MRSIKSCCFHLLAALAVMANLAGAATAENTNTIVRFQLRNGINVVGNIDVELYDQDKPLTVSNFLYHVRSGSYDHSIVHRVVPSFVVQGGLYTVPNPYLPAAFTYMNRIPEGEPIISEATNNRIIPNTFGTLAMALSTTNAGHGSFLDPNSATTSWYFNTADNSADLPEFTVFGRVTSGSQYLRAFNELSENAGIINMFSAPYLSSTCDLVQIDEETDIGLEGLPVGYKFFDCPQNSDLFNVTISVLSSATNNLDSTPPKITVISPANNATLTNRILTVTGTVLDNTAVEKLTLFTSYGEELSPVIAGNTWSQTISNFPAGENSIVVEGNDTAGNRVTVKSGFTYSVSLPVTLTTEGSGTGKILGIANGQSLVVGQSYTVSSKADPGNFFSYWRINGGTGKPESSLTFVMATNLTITAIFETNLFVHAQGTYNGLFYPTNSDIAPDNSGFFSLTLNARGGYTAKMYLNGAIIPLSGAIGFSGSNTHLLFNHPKLPGFTRVQLAVDLQSGSDQLTGLITNFYTTTASNLVAPNLWLTELVTNRWMSTLTANRTTYNARTNPTLHAGKYTIVLPHDPNSAAGPEGDGYGTVTVSAAGQITFSGALPDGTKVTQKTSLSKNGEWPLFASLYKGNGSLLSWVNFTNQNSTDLNGLLNWFKQTQTARYYPDGFTNESVLIGSRFAASRTEPLLGTSNGLVAFIGGNLSADFTNAVAINAKNQVTSLETNKFKLKFNPSNGTFSGSVTPPSGGKALPFQGAVLQGWTSGAGFISGTNRSGRVVIEPE